MSVEQGELLHKELLAVGARSSFVPVEGAGHVFAGYPDAQLLVDQAIAFLAQELEPAGT